MMRTLAAVGLSLGLFAASSTAQAQTHGGFGQQGQFIISADRLFSLVGYSHLAQDNFTPGPGNTKRVDTVNNGSISLLWGSGPVQSLNGVAFVNPFQVPRVGVDYVIAPNWTVGGNVILFFTVGGNTAADTTSNGGVTTSNSADNPGQILFGVEPRGGYILPLSDVFALWLRGGLSYTIQSAKLTQGPQTTTITANQFALDLEPQLVATFVPHVGFTAGVTGDIPITGGHSQDVSTNGRTTSVSAWSGILFIGVQLGMLAYF